MLLRPEYQKQPEHKSYYKKVNSELNKSVNYNKPKIIDSKKTKFLNIHFKYPNNFKRDEQVDSLYVKKLPNRTKSIEELNSNENWLSNLFTKGYNYITRQYNKKQEDTTENTHLIVPHKKESIEESMQEYPTSYSGDTIKLSKYPRRYIVPSSINAKEHSFGIRNRGDRTPINNTEGIIITTFNPFMPYKKFKPDSLTSYIGIDPQGKLKVGTYNNFKDGDYLSKTFSNDVEDFIVDANGNQMWKEDTKHGNNYQYVPVINVKENGKTKQGALNILANQNRKITPDANKYNLIAGGAVILQAGDEVRIVSGSVNDIKKQFYDMKQRHKTSTVKTYTLDAGTYNTGLRTFDKNITTQDQVEYDNQNNGGGNGLYLKSQNSFQFNKN